METFLVALLTLGVILVVAGLAGKVQASQISFGTQNAVARLILTILGFGFIGISLVGLYLSFRPPAPSQPIPTNVAVAPTPTETPQAIATKTIPTPTPTNVAVAPTPTETPQAIATKTIPTPTPTVRPLTAIDEKCKSLGGNPPDNCGLFGASVFPEAVATDNVGHFHHFQGGSVYWHPDTGVHVVFGMILAKWASLGFETSPLGYPMTDELETANKKGRYNNFQGGSIYWSPETNAHAVWGRILAKWASMGYENSPIGFPTTDEVICPDKRGRYNHFQGGSSIYWTPQTDAHVVVGKIRELWVSLGSETSSLGYPTTDELQYGTSNILYSRFERGCISYTGAKGAWVGCP